MKILEKLKNKIEALYTYKAKMQICMLGARGVGKTSVLTSMFDNINKENSQTSLNLATSSIDNDFTKNNIIEKLYNLKQAFRNASTSKYLTNSGIKASFNEVTYSFSLGLKGKTPNIDLFFRDYPGEKIDSDPEMVKCYINDSNALIIAIDSPHLMEEDGKYNEAKNRPKKITAFLTGAFKNLDEDKLVLFVPLKCEKYRNENRMEELTQKIEDTYEELISFFKSDKIRKHIVCAITPIFTMGDVVFDSFECDELGNIILKKDEKNNFNFPVAKYRFTSLLAKYNPQYCEQPLCYLLSFVTKLYYRTKDDNIGKFQKLLNLFKMFPDDPKLLMEVENFASKKVVDKDGYKIINGQRKI